MKPAFLRLALFTAALAVGVGLFAIVVYLSPWIAVGGLFFAAVTTTAATLESRPPSPRPEPPAEEPDEGANGLRRRSRRDIERAAREAREGTEEGRTGGPA